jgi:hypothetical protein
MILTRDGQGAADSRRWVTGKIFGLQIPADVEALLSGGTDFLTRALRASGTLAADNSVRGILGSKEFSGGGTGKKFLLTVEYEAPGTGLPEQLFIKFSRNFDNELWDRGRFLTISEVYFAVLSRAPDFPVPVPATLFADVDPESGTGLIVSECITYGRNGVEPLYLKCMDYEVPDHVGHYKAIVKGLATLSGAHRAGRLPPDFDLEFPYDREQASGPSGMELPGQGQAAGHANVRFHRALSEALSGQCAHLRVSRAVHARPSRRGCRRCPDRRDTPRESGLHRVLPLERQHRQLLVQT